MSGNISSDFFLYKLRSIPITKKCCERLKAKEGGGRGWDCQKALPMQWMWIWANSGKYWRTGKPGLLQPIGSQVVGHDLATEIQKLPRKDGAAVPRLSCCDMSKPFNVEHKHLCLVFQQWHAGCEVLSLLTQQAILWDHLCWKLFCVGQQVFSWDIPFMSSYILGISQAAIGNIWNCIQGEGGSFRQDPPASLKSASCVFLFFSYRRQPMPQWVLLCWKKKKKNLNLEFYRLVFEAKMGCKLGVRVVYKLHWPSSFQSGTVDFILPIGASAHNQWT